MPPLDDLRLESSFHFVAKILSVVEAGARERGEQRSSSHQHELNGTKVLRDFLGEAEYRQVEARWIELLDDSGPLVYDIRASWYDARRNQHHRAPEWRLYFSGDPTLAEGDLIALLRTRGSQAPVFFHAESGSTWFAQLTRVLGAQEAERGSLRVLDLETLPVEFLPILDELLEAASIPTQLASAQGGLSALERFPSGMPSTHELSEYAQSIVDTTGRSADDILLEWWVQEEAIFRQLEERELSQRLARHPPFDGVEDFVSYSLSIHNRRKSRAGRALENHVEALLTVRGVDFTRGAKTEGARRPDFVLPSITAYHDSTYPNDRLLILAAKTTCKDRWRQVLNEAARVRTKHLLTLEPSISTQQLEEMRDEAVVVVAPQRILDTYSLPRRMSVLTVEAFITVALQNQSGR